MATFFLILVGLSVVVALGYQLGREPTRVMGVPLDLVVAAGALLVCLGAAWTERMWWPAALVVSVSALGTYLHVVTAELGRQARFKELAPARTAYAQKYNRLMKFLGGLTREQGDLVFGTMEHGHLMAAGIIEKEKAELVLRVAHGISLPTELEEIEHLGLDNDQLLRIRDILSAEQFAAFTEIFGGWPASEKAKTP